MEEPAIQPDDAKHQQTDNESEHPQCSITVTNE